MWRAASLNPDKVGVGAACTLESARTPDIGANTASSETIASTRQRDSR